MSQRNMKDFEKEFTGHPFGGGRGGMTCISYYLQTLPFENKDKY